MNLTILWVHNFHMNFNWGGWNKKSCIPQQDLFNTILYVSVKSHFHLFPFFFQKVNLTHSTSFNHITYTSNFPMENENSLRVFTFQELSNYGIKTPNLHKICHRCIFLFQIFKTPNPSNSHLWMHWTHIFLTFSFFQ
jgi:hypothetical protein